MGALLAIVAALLLAGAAIRGGPIVVTPCLGRLVKVEGASNEKVADLPELPVRLIRESRSANWMEGGTFERDWALGPLVAFERGTYYRSSYPSNVGVGLASGCDDTEIVHDGYMSGSLALRRDERNDIWWVLTMMSGAKPAIATPLRIDTTRRRRYGPQGSGWFTPIGLIAFAAAAWLFAAMRRHRRRAGWVEAIVEVAGVATTVGGDHVRVEAEVGSSVLVLHAEAPASTYREDAIPAAREFVKSTRIAEEAAARRFRRFAALAYWGGVVAALLAIARV